ncbi:DUF5682 family protein [Bacteroides sp.]|uniref:DUF5682 family protein n=1 Tax=Bacteroides sp. TaxID=29523 RepID=UPI0023C7E939|nr:DUF5682 family protein [Bacteroides sp.]MDE6217193.1 hypothetical protein [Bacteroides sp.]
MTDIHLLGIRHHGPGSCRNILQELERIRPDLILLEGPAEAEALMPFIADGQMEPPVALLGYQPDAPQNAVFYPFADFSPEWQALRYALRENVTLRFFDLPLVHSLAFEAEKQEGGESGEANGEVIEKTGDPFDLLAEAAGYSDGESWWNMNIEQRRENCGIFEAVKEAVTALREALPGHTSRRDLVREAWMRRMIRAAQKESFGSIAVICGAWHVPALENMPKVKEDNELLKGLPKVKTECTWIPWTYNRLTFRSGYGAGIDSPGWYHYLWHHPDDDGTLWVSHIAALLRQKNMDVSVAHVIETVRLAQATAALRGMPAPTLEEYNEAVTAVMGFGDDMLLQLIRESLIVGNRLGKVPEAVPKVPLLIDVERLQKRLRLPFTAEIKEMTLDLRKEIDLERSLFFHRLALLDIDWAKPEAAGGKGTFKEKWTLYHKPEQLVCIIERAVWGNTVKEAVQKYISDRMVGVTRIPELTKLLNRVIPADLPELVEAMTIRLDRLSAASADIVEMMEAVPDLVNIVRYGDVRNLDFSKVGDMLRAMVARILAGGLLVCINIDEEAAGGLLEHLSATNYAVSTLDDEELNGMWYEFVQQIRNSSGAHPLLSGYAARILYDKGRIAREEMRDALSFYSSVGNAPSDTAYWFEGFLRSSGSVLLLDDNLWQLVNGWLCGLSDGSFIELLPVIRRTFSNFTTAERRKLGEKAKEFEWNGTDTKTVVGNHSCNDGEASKVIPLLGTLLGIG